MRHYQHIVVGVDFSPASLSATRTAVRLAMRHGTPITVVHVVEPKQISMVKKNHAMSESDFLSSASDHLHGFLERAEAVEAKMTVEVAIGHPLHKLTEACTRHERALLALGTRGTKHGPNQIGTIATKCVRDAPTDILLVRGGKDAPFKRIVACVDFSENSANVVRSAMRIAEDDGAELECVFVFKASLGMTANYGNIMPTVPDVELKMPTGLKEDLKDFVRPILAGSRLTPSSRVLAGASVRDRIFEYAREAKADLVVLGSHGEHGLHTLLMGTTVENIVTHAPCSVLAVRPTSVAATGTSGAR